MKVSAAFSRSPAADRFEGRRLVPLLSDRSRRDDRFLEWKVRLFSVSAAVAIVGIYLDERWMTGLALVLLLGGLFLRFFPGATASPDQGDEGEEAS